MDADSSDFAILADRNRNQIERHAAMNRRFAVGLGHQRHLATGLEIADRALATAFVGRLAGEAEQAQTIGAFLARSLDLEPGQGHCATGKPAQQCCALGIVGGLGIGLHPRLHRPPVGHCGAHVGQHLGKLGA